MRNICLAYSKPVSCKSFKVDDAEKYAKMQHIWPYEGALRELPLHALLLESCCRADVKLKFTCNAKTYRFRDICCQMAKISV